MKNAYNYYFYHSFEISTRCIFGIGYYTRFIWWIWVQEDVDVSWSRSFLATEMFEVYEDVSALLPSPQEY